MTKKNVNRFGRRFGSSLYSRKQVLKGLGVAGAGVAAAGLGLGGVARALDLSYVDASDLDNIKVYPKDSYPDDHENVQWAVDNVTAGGTVHLMPGEFDFGADGHVVVDKQLTLNGGGSTTIKNGLGPGFFGGTIMNLNNLGKLKIDGINMEGAIGNSINSVDSSDLEVCNCRFIDNQPYQSPFLPPGYTAALGVYLQSSSGKVILNNNYVDLKDTGALYSRGLVIADSPGVSDMEINNNEIKMIFNAASFMNAIAIETFYSCGTITVGHNHITAGRCAIMVIGNSGPAYVYDNTGEVNPGVVFPNDVDDGNFSSPIWVASYSEDAGVISGNDFHMTNCWGGVHICFPFGYQPPLSFHPDVGYNGGVIKSNKFTGTLNRLYSIKNPEVMVGHGMTVLDPYNPDNPFNDTLPTLPTCTNNIFTGNNLVNVMYEEYNTPALTYMFPVDSTHNIVKGFTGGNDRVVDFGSDNLLTGVTPMDHAGGIGPGMSQAMKAMAKELHMLPSEEP